MNAKAKGSRREREVRDELEKEGYAVTKAGGSLGVWDVIALGPADNKVVQVKSNKPPGPAERQRMLDFKVAPDTTKWLVVIKDGTGVKGWIWTRYP